MNDTMKGCMPLEVVAQALRDGQLVGLGEAHGFGGIFSVLQALVLAPSLSPLYDDIYVEFGNRKHQAMLNHYLAGESVPASELAAIWLDSMAFPAWLPPQYGDFFAQVRQANLNRPRPLKVHLMEPDFDWQQLHSPSDLAALNRQRDEAMFAMLRHQLIIKKQPAIVLVGARHLLKKPITGFAVRGQRSLGELFERAYPKRLMSIWPHMRDDSQLGDNRLDEMPVPCVINAEDLAPSQPSIDAATLKQPKLRASAAPALFELVDGYLYCGPQQRWDNAASIKLNARWQATLSSRLSLLNERQRWVCEHMLGCSPNINAAQAHV